MLKGMHTKSIAQKLLAVTPEFVDRQVAMMIADRCMELGDKPYRFAIDHDIRPPGLKACPLSHYDWTKKDTVGIDTLDSATARRWLTSAALWGYTITRVDATYNDMVPGFSSSIAIVRRRAESHQRPRIDNGDDIPF
jgi:hypothetical protein